MVCNAVDSGLPAGLYRYDIKSGLFYTFERTHHIKPYVHALQKAASYQILIYNFGSGLVNSECLLFTSYMFGNALHVHVYMYIVSDCSTYLTCNKVY